MEEQAAHWYQGVDGNGEAEPRSRPSAQDWTKVRKLY